LVERTDERLLGNDGHEIRVELLHAESLAAEAVEACFS